MDFNLDDLKLGTVWCILIAWFLIMAGVCAGSLYVIIRIVMGLM